jgi:hypothetical protein
MEELDKVRGTVDDEENDMRHNRVSITEYFTAFLDRDEIMTSFPDVTEEPPGPEPRHLLWLLHIFLDQELHHHRGEV